MLSCSEKTHEITLGSLLEEMVDRNTAAQFPVPHYTCRQFSSYDRATTTPDDKSWFANWDRSMFIRTETNNDRQEYVMMDTEGPGAIVRFWMTFAGQGAGSGILRVYLDNGSDPVIEGKAFDIISGGQLTGEPLSSSVSDSTAYNRRGHNLYFPIPYAQHCKVTYESDNIKDAGARTGGEAVYYNINYRTYPEGTPVESYSAEKPEKYRAEIESVQKVLGQREVIMPENNTQNELTGTIDAGKNISATLTGKSAIRMLRFKVEAKNLPQALRSTILEISFDGNKTVSSPIGDFFGTGYQIRQSNTWYTKVEDDGTMSCFWVMPFRKNCTVSIVNHGQQPVQIIQGDIISAPYKWDSNTLYFGASWQQYTYLKTGEMKTNEGDGYPFDLNYVTLNGKGRYAGDGITLFNTVYAWWGEGDEKIYVDNESFPSHIGTGTEDYYGYAWCRPEKFSNHPFVAQPDGSGNFDPGYTVNLRFRALDAIPFSKSLKMDMEMWHWTKATINFAPVTFWYISPADAGKQNVSVLKDAAEPVVLERKHLISSALENNKIEGEHMNLEKMTGGRFRYSNNENQGWSNNVLAVWSEVSPGNTLELSFTSPDERTADARIMYPTASDYSTFRLVINDNAPIVINAYNKEFAIAQKTIGQIKLKKGENRVVMTILSDNKDRRKAGLDCITF